MKIGMGVGSGIHLYDSHRGIQQLRLIYVKININIQVS